MIDLHTIVFEWLVHDYEDYRRGLADKSALCTYLLASHERAFRIHAKRLLRLAESDDSQRKELLQFLISELVDRNRLIGSKSRIDSVLKSDSLMWLISMDRTNHYKFSNGINSFTKKDVKEARQALIRVKILLECDSIITKEIDWNEIVALVKTMLIADHLPSKVNRCERVLELWEDERWKETHGGKLLVQDNTSSIKENAFDVLEAIVKKFEPRIKDKVLYGVNVFDYVKESFICGSASEGDGYSALIRTLIEDEADQFLANLGWRSPIDIRRGKEFNEFEESTNCVAARGFSRKQELPSSLISYYIDQCGTAELLDKDKLFDEIYSLYISLSNDEKKRNAFIPVHIDEQTGVTLYILGKDMLNKYTVNGAACKEVSVAAIDHRLFELYGSDQTDRYIKYSKKPVILYSIVTSIEDYLGQTKNPTEREIKKAMKSLYKSFIEMKMRYQDSLASFNGVEPEKCPDQFKYCFNNCSQQRLVIG